MGNQRDRTCTDKARNDFQEEDEVDIQGQKYKRMAEQPMSETKFSKQERRRKISDEEGLWENKMRRRACRYYAMIAFMPRLCCSSLRENLEYSSPSENARIGPHRETVQLTDFQNS